MALFVARLPFTWTSDDLKKLVSKYGEVTRCDVPPNKGYGFVNFQNKEDAERCIKELDNTTQDWGNSIAPGRIAVEWSRGGDQPRGGPSGRGCFRCGKEGHFARDCPDAMGGGAGGFGSGSRGYDDRGSSSRYEERRDDRSRYDDRRDDRSSGHYDDRRDDRSSRSYDDRREGGSSSRGYDDRREGGSSSRSYDDRREEDRGSSSRAYDDRREGASSSSRYDDRRDDRSYRSDDRHRSSRDKSRSRSPRRSRSRSR